MKPRPGVATAAVIAAAMLVIAAITVGYVVYSSSGTPTVSTSTSTSTSTTATTVLTSTNVGSAQGLELRMSINASSIREGGAIEVNLSEFNTLDHNNNVSKADS